MADKIDRDLAELKSLARDFQSDEPQRFPTEEEVEKGMKESYPIDLSKKPEMWELREALGVTRAEVGLALASAASVIEELLDEIRRLKMHRHDTTKSYSGRPEM